MTDFDQLDRYMVISADCHAGADIQAYKPYLEQKWYDEFEEWAQDFVDPWSTIDQGSADRKSGVTSSALEANWNNEIRNADLDQDGITAEVVFPNTVPPFFPSGVLTAAGPTSRAEYERRRAGLHAHNRWLVDFCAESPGRRAGIAQIFLNDVDDAVADVQWIKESGLTGGILLPSVAPGSDLPPLFSPEYEPLWATCEDLGIPINHHGGIGGPAGHPGTGPAVRAIGYIESRFFTNRSLWHLIFGGVFERHPNLHYILTEQGMSWVPERLSVLDSVYRQGRVEGLGVRNHVGPAVDDLPRLPSEYFAQNCYIGVSFMLPLEAKMLDQVGIDRVMWGSDYPHSEGTFPYTKEALRACFATTSVDDVRRIVGGTAAKVYGFDVNKLASVTSRIGPRFDEIGTPLTEYPRVPEDSACPVFSRLRVA